MLGGSSQLILLIFVENAHIGFDLLAIHELKRMIFLAVGIIALAGAVQHTITILADLVAARLLDEALQAVTLTFLEGRLHDPGERLDDADDAVHDLLFRTHSEVVHTVLLPVLVDDAWFIILQLRERALQVAKAQRPQPAVRNAGRGRGTSDGRVQHCFNFAFQVGRVRGIDLQINGRMIRRLVVTARRADILVCRRLLSCFALPAAERRNFRQFKLFPSRQVFHQSFVNCVLFQLLLLLHFFDSPVDVGHFPRVPRRVLNHLLNALEIARRQRLFVRLQILPDSDLLQVDGFVTLNNLVVKFLDFSVLPVQPLIQRLNDALVFPLQGVLRIRQDPVLALQLLKVLSVEHHL